MISRIENTFKALDQAFGKKIIRKLMVLQIVSVFVALLEVFSISLLLPVLQLTGTEGYHTILGLEFSTINLQLLIVACMLSITVLVLLGHRFLLTRSAWLGGELSFLVFAAKYKISYTDLMNKPVSHWNNVVVNETARAAHQVIIPATKIVGKLIFSFLLLVIAFVTNSMVSIFLFLFLTLFYLMVYYFVRPKLAQASVDISASTEQRLKLVNISYYGYGEVLIFGLQKRLSRAFETYSTNFGEALGRTMVYGIAPRYILEGLVGLTVGAVAVYWSFNPTEENTTDDFIFMAILFIRLLPAVQEIYQSIAAIRSHWSAFDVALEILKNQSEDFHQTKQIRNIHSECNTAPTLQVNIEELSLNSQKLLHDIQFELSVGEFLTITGESGCGKSTLLKAICGLIPSYTGNVHVLGRNGQEFKWAYVGQQSAIIGDDLISNIILDAAYDEDKFKEVLSGCLLTELYSKISHQKNTHLNLDRIVSGGERQRIAIARAIYQNCGGYIFDEATSGLDQKTEETILKFIRQQTSGSFCISVAHRSSVIDASDKVIHISDGTCEVFCK